MKKNKEREKANTFYIQSLKSTLIGNDEGTSIKYLDHMDHIIDIRFILFIYMNLLMKGM